MWLAGHSRCEMRTPFSLKSLKIHIMEKFISFVMYLWQLPQNIVGLVLRLFYPGKDTEIAGGGITVRKSVNMRGGISLGQYVIISQWAGEKTVNHELGHCVQSQYLGWLYLIIIGLPSVVWAALHTYVKSVRAKWSYYDFYAEKWADELGGVVR